ncbi:MAG: type IA DNA topoisomerase [Lachnospiraceae bacterium]|nr:type IA DNA topoisomerase [Lachnospiraceae bacterium]
MGKSLFIAEKPSVAQEFAKALKLNTTRKDGYLEAQNTIVTWCVGHLVTMSYPDAYDEKYKKWSLDTIPFVPQEFKYEVIPSVEKQFKIVSGLLNREDVSTIYVCTDSGREGEYIYRLVEMQSGMTGKERKRVWIDSQTEEEILRGIKEAKDLSEYDNLCASAYLRAKEDYLMGINFSRALTLKFGYPLRTYLNTDKCVVSVGRVMTCVLGMIVNREREIRNFVKTPFYKVISDIGIASSGFAGEWKVWDESHYMGNSQLYKENGFLKEEVAQECIDRVQSSIMTVYSIEKKREVKNPPLLYNLAELQNDCSKYFKISPDETLQIVQELYEKKLVTYPRTDARVLSTAVAKEISKNIRGLQNYSICAELAGHVLEKGSYKNIAKTKYVNDKQITDHYAIIPTGQGLNALNSLHATAAKVYEIIVRRFLCIFYPPAVYQKVSLVAEVQKEHFVSSFKVLKEPGYFEARQFSFFEKKDKKTSGALGESTTESVEDGSTEEEDMGCDENLLSLLSGLKKGDELSVNGYTIKPGETSPPKRYNSGSIILAMENAGQLIEDEELRAQIKGSGIGTSATRAEILKKLVNIKYLSLNKKTQIITPTFLGEVIFEVVSSSIKPLLDPRLTASWEKGLTMVADGSITSDEYMKKLDDFVSRRTNLVKQVQNQTALYRVFDGFAEYYKKERSKSQK